MWPSPSCSAWEHQLDVEVPKRIQEVRADVELLDRAVAALQAPIDAEPVAARYVDDVEVS